MQFRPENIKAGFTLIEVMVATTILVMIVLMMSQLFHQSSIAWDSGMRKAEGNLGARSVIGFMSRELQTGVLLATNHPFMQASEPGYLNNGEGNIRFYSFTGTNGPALRDLKVIEYIINGAKVYRREEQCKKGTGIGDYGTAVFADKVELINGVTSLAFETPFDASNPNGRYTTNMPAWVRIKLGMTRTDDVSGISCRSAGPDHNFNTADDITGK